MSSLATILRAAFTAPPGGCVAIAGAWITGGDLGRALPQFQSLPESAIVASAPAPGAVRVLSIETLDRFARSHGAAAPLAAACFVLAAAPPDPQVMLEALLRSMAARFPEAGAWQADIVSYSRDPAPEGNVSFSAVTTVSPDRSDGSRLYRGSVVQAGGRVFPVWLRVRLRVERSCSAVASDLAPGRFVAPGQVRVEKAFHPAPGPRCIASAAELEGRIPVRAIPRGTLLSPNMFRPAPVVSRGDDVAVEVRSGSARITFHAKSEGSGHSGEKIALVNRESGKRFTARIVGPGRAVLETVKGNP